MRHAAPLTALAPPNPAPQVLARFLGAEGRGETQGEACGRAGLAMAADVVGLDRWVAEAASAASPPGTSGASGAVVVPSSWSVVLRNLTARFGGVDGESGGCCAPGLWCRDAAGPAGRVCISHSRGGSVFVNYGWFHRDWRPMYACVATQPATAPPCVAGPDHGPPAAANASAANGTVDTPSHEVVQAVEAVRVVAAEVSQAARAPAAGIVGAPARGPSLLVHLSTEVATSVAVTVDGVACRDPVACEATCRPCTQSADCSAGQRCAVLWEGASGTCMYPCGPMRGCPCGLTCVQTSAGKGPAFACAPPALAEGGAGCEPPRLQDGAQSVLGCELDGAAVAWAASGPRNGSVSVWRHGALCDAQGPFDTLAHALYGTEVAIASAAASGARQWCTDQAVAAPCSPGPAADSTQLRLLTWPPDASPAGPRAALRRTRLAFPHVTRHTAVVRARGFEAEPWASAVAAGQALSAGEVDDIPTSAVPLPFPATLFGTAHPTLWVSPNANLASHKDTVCLSLPGTGFCDLRQAYSARILLLLADWAPAAAPRSSVRGLTTSTAFTVVYGCIARYSGDRVDTVPGTLASEGKAEEEDTLTSVDADSDTGADAGTDSGTAGDDAAPLCDGDGPETQRAAVAAAVLADGGTAFLFPNVSTPAAADVGGIGLTPPPRYPERVFHAGARGGTGARAVVGGGAAAKQRDQWRAHPSPPRRMLRPAAATADATAVLQESEQEEEEEEEAVRSPQPHVSDPAFMIDPALVLGASQRTEVRTCAVDSVAACLQPACATAGETLTLRVRLPRCATEGDGVHLACDFEGWVAPAWPVDDAGGGAWQERAGPADAALSVLACRVPRLGKWPRLVRMSLRVMAQGGSGGPDTAGESRQWLESVHTVPLLRVTRGEGGNETAVAVPGWQSGPYRTEPLTLRFAATASDAARDPLCSSGCGGTALSPRFCGPCRVCGEPARSGGAGDLRAAAPGDGKWSSDPLVAHVVDCAGRCFGRARVDSCGVCAGGLTGLQPGADRDCAGICFGNTTQCDAPPLPPGGGGVGANDDAPPAQPLYSLLRHIAAAFAAVNVPLFTVIITCYLTRNVASYRRQRAERGCVPCLAWATGARWACRPLLVRMGYVDAIGRRARRHGRGRGLSRLERQQLAAWSKVFTRPPPSAADSHSHNDVPTSDHAANPADATGPSDSGDPAHTHALARAHRHRFLSPALPHSWAPRGSRARDSSGATHSVSPTAVPRGTPRGDASYTGDSSSSSGDSSTRSRRSAPAPSVGADRVAVRDAVLTPHSLPATTHVEGASAHGGGEEASAGDDDAAATPTTSSGGDDSNGANATDTSSSSDGDSDGGDRRRTERDRTRRRRGRLHTSLSNLFERLSAASTESMRGRGLARDGLGNYRLTRPPTPSRRRSRSNDAALSHCRSVLPHTQEEGGDAPAADAPHAPASSHGGESTLHRRRRRRRRASRRGGGGAAGSAAAVLDSAEWGEEQSRARVRREAYSDGGGDSGGVESAAGSEQPADADNTCAVCLATLETGDRILWLPCGHVFHAGCVLHWLQFACTCPLCKDDVRARMGGVVP